MLRIARKPRDIRRIAMGPSNDVRDFRMLPQEHHTLVVCLSLHYEIEYIEYIIPKGWLILNYFPQL